MAASTEEKKAGQVVKDILHEVSTLVRAVADREVRLVLRSLRHSSSSRRSLTPAVLSAAAAHSLSAHPDSLASVTRWIPRHDPSDYPVPDLSDTQDTDTEKSTDDAEKSTDDAEKSTDDAEKKKKNEGKESSSSSAASASDAAAAASAARRRKMPVAPTEAQLVAAPEARAFVQLLCLLHLVDRRDTDEAVACSEDLVSLARGHARVTMDALAARAWFYLVRSFELSGLGTDPLRPRLLAAYRTSCLRHDAAGQAVLLNLLVRGYLASGLLDQADKLVAKAEFPADASPNQLARHLHYVGWIRAVQLDYTDAHRSLSLALRKAPQAGARGFRLLTTKLAVVVQLLMGEIPDRATFAQRDLAPGLRPYFELTKAVRDGDLGEFGEVVSRHAQVFAADRTAPLVSRLRASVLKAGLRRISAAYSAIPLAQVAARLRLEDPADAAGIVAKAIHDGVIDAAIDHEGAFVRSKDAADAYAGNEPRQAFHSRIEYALNVKNEATRAMRYPDDKRKESPEEAEERRKRLAEEEELAQTLADEDDADEF